MWILESNGDFLQGKRMWLKPGQKYLFGRVKREGVRFAIDHKTVSRKHFIIEVDPVKEGDVARIHARTKVSIQDLNSKAGTWINGELVKNATKALAEAETSIRPGSCPHEIVITWHPVVLTFQLLKKDVKAGLLKAKQSRVQGLDIKATADFFADSTTHVVAGKRNTAKGLQALVTAKYLVNDAYLDALEYAATPTNLSQEENLSPLEIDFDEAWPKPKAYLPPPGKEPTIRPPECYEPNPARSQVFEGRTFVFLDKAQYENLLPVVTCGHGKALLFKLTPHQTTVDELIQFLQNAVGSKSGGSDRPQTAILVRWAGNEDSADWLNSLINATALKTDQRAVEQSEFLDAILGNDADALQQPIPFESTNEGRVAPPPSVVQSLDPLPDDRTQPQRTAGVHNRVNGHSASSSAPVPKANSLQIQTSRSLSKPAAAAPSPTPEPAPAPAVRTFQRARFTQVKGFKAFDDGFDPDAVAPYDSDEDEQQQQQPAHPASDARFKSSGKVKDEPTSSRKRPHSPLPEEEHDDFRDDIDALLPAATALKRRRLAEGRTNGEADVLAEVVQPLAKKKKKERELDVREALRAQKEERDESAQRESRQLEDFDPNPEDRSPANLVEVVTMTVPLRDKTNLRTTTSELNTGNGEEWDPEWNGRKNFKGFRRKGQPAARTTHKVIVPLIEMEQKGCGLGEQYWDKSDQQKEREKRRKERDSAKSQSQSRSERNGSRVQSAPGDEDEGDISAAEDDGDQDGTLRASPEASRLRREAADIAGHDIDPDTPRRTRASDRRATESPVNDRTQRLSQLQDLDSTIPASSSTSKARGKRPAAASATTAPKRQKTLPVTVVNNSEDDDSDDLKFKFGRGARRGRGRGRGRGNA